MEDLFSLRAPWLIGMVHLRPLPGSVRCRQAFPAVLESALEDARALEEGGMRALLVENHGDAPFAPTRVEPHVVAMLAVIVREVRSRSALPVGVNCLRNDGRGALAAAAAGGASFVRINVLTGITATDQGLIEGDAQTLLRYRARVCPEVRILADLDVKFGTPLFRPPLEDRLTSLVERGCADAVILTGTATGRAADPDEVRTVARVLGDRAPLLVGSGVTPANLSDYLPCVRGCIVGTALKRNADVAAPVDPAAVRALAEAAARAG